MTQIFKATYDGKVFRPEEPIQFPPHTSVEIVARSPEENVGKPYSLFRLASAAKLKGPKDFSTNLDEYLYQGKPIE